MPKRLFPTLAFLSLLAPVTPVDAAVRSASPGSDFSAAVQIAPPRIEGARARGDAEGAEARSGLRDGGFLIDGDGRSVHDAVIGSGKFGVTMRRPDGGYNTVAHLTVSRVDIAATGSPIAIRGGSHDILIEDARLRCIPAGNGFPEGIKIGAHQAPADYGITVRRAIISGCESRKPGKYTQGDGISTERADHDITIVDTVSTDHGDGCLDLKSSATRLDNIWVARCNFGARLWAQGTVGTIHVGEVDKAAIYIRPTTDWTIDRLYLPAAVPSQGDIWSDGAGGHLVVAWCSRPVTLGGGAATVDLGPSCRRD